MKKSNAKPLATQTKIAYISLAAIILVLLIGYSFGVKFISINGTSMSPMLKDGQVIIATKARELQVGDIVIATVDYTEQGENSLNKILENDAYSKEQTLAIQQMLDYSNPKKTQVVKRIVAVPGDTVYYHEHDHGLYVNNKIAKTITTMNEPGLLRGKITLSDNEYLLIGDNYNRSIDSRFFGPVKRNLITHKYINTLF